MNLTDQKPGAQRASMRSARPGRPRSPTVDRAILRATLELFIERGFGGVGIEQVAERAGVARTTVYRRWRSKESLIAEAIAQGRGEAEKHVLRNPASRKAATRSVVDALAETLSTTYYRRMVARLIGSIPDRPELMATYWKTYLVPRRKVVADALERARGEGSIGDSIDTETLLDLVGGAILYHLLIRPGDRSEKDIRSYVRKLLGELGLDDATQATGAP